MGTGANRFRTGWFEDLDISGQIIAPEMRIKSKSSLWIGEDTHQGVNASGHAFIHTRKMQIPKSLADAGITEQDYTDLGYSSSTASLAACLQRPMCRWEIQPGGSCAPTHSATASQLPVASCPSPGESASGTGSR